MHVSDRYRREVDIPFRLDSNPHLRDSMGVGTKQGKPPTSAPAKSADKTSQQSTNTNVLTIKVNAVDAGSDKDVHASFQLPRQDSSEWTDATFLHQRKAIFYMLVQMGPAPKVPGSGTASPRSGGSPQIIANSINVLKIMVIPCPT